MQAGEFCTADCNLDGLVGIDELLTAVSISLDLADLESCLALDSDCDRSATIVDLTRAVNDAFGDCAVAPTYDCPWPDLADDDIHAFLMAGQSNMRGVGNPDDVPEDLQEGAPRVLDLGTEWRTLRPGHDFFGPEIGFAHTLATACPKSRIGVVKRHRVASGINAWLRDWNEELAKLVGNPDVGPLYPTLMERVDLAERSGPVTWEGFIWVHGHTDKNLRELAESYGDNLELLVEAVREDLGRPDLPVVVQHALRKPPQQAELSANLVLVGHGIVELEKWKAQFEIPRTFGADWTLLPRRDFVHLTSEGYLRGGRLLAEALLDGLQSEAARSDEE